ncbi:hypothetical protein [Terriglobus sp. ADX1]|uniref:hypothetical protein n=1 Tax=Terriglobus sp. ADX1 TaxID=2794063 RepID=UPI002FE53991
MRPVNTITLVLLLFSATEVFTLGFPANAQAPPAEALAFGSYASMGKISDLILAAKRTNQKQITIVRKERSTHLEGATPTDRDAQVRDSIANSDAVVVGHVLQRSCALTADGSFVYSAFVVQVDDVMKQDRPIADGDHLRIVHPGGVIHDSGVSVIAMDPDALPIERGKEYVFFLHRLRGSSEYKVGADDAIDVSNPTKILSSRNSAIRHSGTTADFIAKIKQLSTHHQQ